MTRVVVVGGGLAGLAAARRLAADGFDVTLYERDSELGGRVRSTHENGYTFDRGFQVLFTAYPAAQRELDYDDLDLRSFSPGVVVCRGDRRSVLADPFRDPGSLVESALNTEVSFADKLRVLWLRRELAGKSREDVFSSPDASIESYLRDRGFSEAFVDRFARPFYGGITLDRTLGTSKRVFEFTFGMLAAGGTAVPANGMGAIADQLASRAAEAGAELVCDTTIERVDGDDDDVAIEVTGDVMRADAAVVAANPRSSYDLTGVDAIPTDAKGCVTQYFALPEGHPAATGDRLHLNADSDVPNAVAPLSGVAPKYAPDDRALLAASTVGPREETDDALAVATRDALELWYPEASFDSLGLLHTERVDFAQFAQPPGCHESLPDVRDPDGPVYLAGDYTHHASIDGALESGVRAARAVREDAA